MSEQKPQFCKDCEFIVLPKPPFHGTITLATCKHSLFTVHKIDLVTGVEKTEHRKCRELRDKVQSGRPKCMGFYA